MIGTEASNQKGPPAMRALWTPATREDCTAGLLCGARNRQRDQSRDSRPFHRHAVDMVGALHGALVVRDHDELRAALEFAHQAGEGGEAELVERRVDLIHYAKRTRIEQEERKDQRHRAQRLLATREETDLLDLLARRLDQD